MRFSSITFTTTIVTTLFVKQAVADTIPLTCGNGIPPSIQCFIGGPLVCSEVDCFNEQPSACNIVCPETMLTVCSLAECPTVNTIMECTADTMVCEITGQLLYRDPSNNCEFPPCTCPDDQFYCGGGVFVGRNILDNCNFFSCPNNDIITPNLCGSMQMFLCPDGTTVCSEAECSSLACNYPCPDGTLACSEAECYTPTCPENTLMCPNGFVVTVLPDCSFPPCPSVRRLRGASDTEE